MSKWYKVNLLPLGPYFFGQELVAEFGNRQNYFRRSASFPQQSTLLGMLRHQILLQHGLAHPPVNGAKGSPKDLIAHEGFKPEGNAKQGYGKIKQLSPVFVQRNESGHYFLRDSEWVQNGKEGACLVAPGGQVSYSSLSGGGLRSIKLVCMPSKKAYTGKCKPVEYLIDLDEGSKVELGNVFHEATATGVYKFVSRSSEADYNQDAAYFKNVSKQLLQREAIPWSRSAEQEFYRRTVTGGEQGTRWSFAFYVEMADDKTLAPSGYRVAIMGKERSAFLVQVSDVRVGDQKWMQPTVAGGMQKVVLLSDAYMEESELLPHSLLIVGSTVRFRSFTRDYSKHSFKHAQLHRDAKSNCHHLLRRGSVIYTENAAEVAVALQAPANWRAIGNNYFTVVSPES